MPEIDRDGGTWDMRTEGIEAANQTLHTGVDSFEQAWKSAEATVLGNLGSFGYGALGEDFWPKYHPAAQQMGDFVRKVTPFLRDVAAATDKSIAEYIAADQEGARGIGGGG